MAFIPIPNCAKLSLEFIVGGVPIVLTFGICKGSPITTTDLTAAATAANNWWETHVRPLQTLNVVLQGTRVTDQTSQFAAEVFVPKTTNNAGTHNDGIIPNNAALAVQRRTLLRGRAHRGTSYFFGFGQSRLTSATTVTPAFEASVLTAYDQFEPNLALAGFNEAVLSRTLNGQPRVTGVGTDVVSHSLNGFVDDMGRRLR